MKLIPVLVVCGAVIITAGTSALAADVAAQNGPIQINDVQVGLQTNDMSNLSSEGSIGIDFTNTAASRATDVVFAIESDGAVLDRIDDVGSFANGTAISHVFKDTLHTPNQQIVVAAATFADATTWVNPDVPAAPKSEPALGVPATIDP